MKSQNENPLIAAIHISKNTHRRYGAQITHMGMILIMSGVAGSSLYNTNHTFKLHPNETIAFDQYQMTYEGLEEKVKANHTAVQAVIALTDPQNITHVVRPQVRFFEKTKEPNREVAIMSSWKRDVYFVLAGWKDDGKLATIQIIINPLVSWIWAGSIIMLVGGMICLVPVTAASHENAPVANTTVINLVNKNKSSAKNKNITAQLKSVS